jgi:hypothetical protein
LVEFIFQRGGFQFIKIYFPLWRWHFSSKCFGAIFFSKQVFKFSAFLFGGGFFAGISSGWFCRVAEIGFKVFGLCFGLRWF